MISASTKEFPPFRLDTVNECLWRHQDSGDDERIRLTPKAFAVLRYLVSHPGRLVTQNELLEAVWPNTFVQPEVLKSQILDVRHALGDDAKDPRFIETLPRRGYQFVAPVADAFAAMERENEGGSAKLVGRDAELKELRNCLQRSLVNQRQVVFVTGETGIGKTALVDEFTRRAAAEFPGVRVARGQCVEGYGSKEAYYPILEALSQLCCSSGRDTVVETLAVQAPTWLVQFPAHVRGEQREIQGQIVSSTPERMLREIIEAMETISSEKPLLLVFEDLHWADPSTVDFISALGRRRSGGKLMLIGTYRPVDVAVVKHPLKEVKQDLLVHKLCREIALQPLTEGEVAEYLAIETPGVALPQGLPALIHRHSEGNPLFMVSILDDLRDRGMIAIENGTWQIKVPLESIHLEAPESLRQMIELQIETLSSDEQRVLELASVTGMSFTANANVLGTTVDQEKLESTCEDLARRQHIVRRTGWRPFSDGTISQCYEFAHALHREVFYRRQAPSQRARVCIEGTPAPSFLTA
jgi:predicted ATPase